MEGHGDNGVKEEMRSSENKPLLIRLGIFSSAFQALFTAESPDSA